MGDGWIQVLFFSNKFLWGFSTLGGVVSNLSVLLNLFLGEEAAGDVKKLSCHKPAGFFRRIISGSIRLKWSIQSHPFWSMKQYNQYEDNPGKLTWNLRIQAPWKRKILYQIIIFRFYVNLRGCILPLNTRKCMEVLYDHMLKLKYMLVLLLTFRRAV